MADDEDVAALVIDNGSGMCKGMSNRGFLLVLRDESVFPVVTTRK
jgi:hypothetical protein